MFNQVPSSEAMRRRRRHEGDSHYRKEWLGTVCWGTAHRKRGTGSIEMKPTGNQSSLPASGCAWQRPFWPCNVHKARIASLSCPYMRNGYRTCCIPDRQYLSIHNAPLNIILETICYAWRPLKRLAQRNIVGRRSKRQSSWLRARLWSVEEALNSHKPIGWAQTQPVAPFPAASPQRTSLTTR